MSGQLPRMLGAVHLVLALSFLAGTAATYVLGKAMLDSMVALIGTIALLAAR
jgi:hypothetical protein